MPDTNTVIDAIPAMQAGAPTRCARLLANFSCASTVLRASAATALLATTSACAQTATLAPPVSAASQAASAPVAPPDAAKAAPKYSAVDIERAFNFMDANRDGKVSRAEAARFRNVARHFDAADTDKDGTLTLGEFGNALNRP